MNWYTDLPKFSFMIMLCLCIVLKGNAQTGLNQNNNEFFISESVYITEGANVYVMGDVVVGSNNAELNHEGTLQIQGNFILAPGGIIKSSNGKVVMRNNHVNQGIDQYFDGDFTGVNAIPKLVIHKRHAYGVVYLKNGNLEVEKRLRLRNGRLRTGPVGYDNGGDYPFKVHLLNDNPNAIVGHTSGNSNSNYIEGKLERAVGLGPYFFPIGPKPSGGQGAEPFEINFLASPPSDILGYYENGVSTSLGSVVNCVLTESEDPIETDDDDDGDDDQWEDDDDDDQGEDDDDQGEDDDFEFTENSTYQINCVAGQWVIDGLPLVYFYDVHFFPSSKVLGLCNFESFFMARNGVIENICPVTDYSLYDQKLLGVFDIAGLSGSEFNQNDTEASLENLSTGSSEKPVEDDGTEIAKYSNPESVDGALGSPIEIFPNPVSIGEGVVSLVTENSGPLTISLFDNNGILIALHEINAVAGINKINLLPESMAPGIFHVVVLNAENTHRGRLAVVR